MPPNLLLLINATSHAVNESESVISEKVRCGPYPKEVESFSETRVFFFLEHEADVEAEAGVADKLKLVFVP